MKEPWVRRVAWSPGRGLSAAYRWTWAVLALLTALVSAIASVEVLTPLATLLTLATFLCVFVSGGVLVAWAWERPGWSAVAPTVVASVLLTAWASLLVGIGAWACLLLVLVGTSPRVLSIFQARVSDPDPHPDRSTLGQLMHDRAWRDAEPEDAVRPTSADAVARLSTAGLCRLWSRTTRELGGCDSADRRLELARLRDACLEEMSRRDCAGFARWMGSDPVATDPSGCLRPAASTSPEPKGRHHAQQPASRLRRRTRQV
jgi:hypothetical protein